MKKIALCLGVFLIAFSLLYAQPTPRIQRQREELQPNEEFQGEMMQKQLKERAKETMLRRIQAEDPEAQAMHQKLLELEQKVRELVEKYNTESSPKEQNKIKNEIQNLLNEAFDLKLALEERGLEQLKKKLNELKKFSEARKSNKKEIIEKRLENLLKEKDYLEW